MPIAHGCDDRDPPVLNYARAPLIITPAVRFSLPLSPLPSSSRPCPPASSLPCSAVVGFLSSGPALDRSSPHQKKARVEIYHSNAARLLAPSPHHWTMPTFTPKQKRQSSACECFALLPRHFLCDIAQQIGSIATCVDGGP